jgi:signal transduction histidine kinase
MFSRASRVEVQIQIAQGNLFIRVSDNGHGFAPAARNGESGGAGRHGLENMRQHLADVGGSCDIQSQPGRGASVELKVNLESINTQAA